MYMNIFDSLLLGPTEEQEHLLHCVMQGECKEPLGTGCWTWFYVNVDADDFWWQSLLSFFSFPHSFSSPTTSHCFSTVGLIYVNPGGPVGNKGIPAASAKNIRFPVFFFFKNQPPVSYPLVTSWSILNHQDYFCTHEYERLGDSGFDRWL